MIPDKFIGTLNHKPNEPITIEIEKFEIFLTPYSTEMELTFIYCGKHYVYGWYSDSNAGMSALHRWNYGEEVKKVLVSGANGKEYEQGANDLHEIARQASVELRKKY